MKKIITLSLILLTLFTLSTYYATNSQAQEYKFYAHPTGVENKYYVIFNNDVDVNDIDTLSEELTNSFTESTLIRKMYGPVKGFILNTDQLSAVEISKNKNIRWVEQVVNPILTTTQTGADTSLDRIDQRDLPLNGTYIYGSDGTGTHIYIFDTGIRASHNDFGGRVVTDYDVMSPDAHGNSGNDPYYGQDCNGHGTHVAGVAAGSTYGVAKNATIHNIKAFWSPCGPNPNEYFDNIDAINWVANNRQLPAVANLSYTYGVVSPTLELAIDAMKNAGITVVIASGNAGNTNQPDACDASPGHYTDGIVVGMSSVGPTSDDRHPVSSIGSCIDLFAPGAAVLSAGNSSNTATAVLGGSSISAPFVTGIAALHLQGFPTASPAQVQSAIISAATPNRLTAATLGAGSPNLLAYSYTYPATAANVNVAGQVMASNGMPLSSVLVKLTDSSNNVVSTYTSTFGYYLIPDVEVGNTYTITAIKKGYTFNSQVINVGDEITDLNFIAQ